MEALHCIVCHSTFASFKLLHGDPMILKSVGEILILGCTFVPGFCVILQIHPKAFRSSGYFWPIFFSEFVVRSFISFIGFPYDATNWSVPACHWILSVGKRVFVSVLSCISSHFKQCSVFKRLQDCDINMTSGYLAWFCAPEVDLCRCK